MFKAFATALLLAVSLPGQTRTIDDFFRDFTAEWVRHDPDLATRTRYFTGEEQDRFERQITPHPDAYRRGRIQLARQGLAELRQFDRAKMNQTQRVSAELMGWQLKTIADEEPYLDDSFPLEQFNGLNVALSFRLTITHPPLTEKNAVNYIAALGQAGVRMREAIAPLESQVARATDDAGV